MVAPWKDRPFISLSSNVTWELFPGLWQEWNNHPSFMDINEARGLLGDEYDFLPDETIEDFVELCDTICTYVIDMDDEQVDANEDA